MFTEKTAERNYSSDDKNYPWIGFGVIGCAALIFFSYLNRNFQLDDALIYQRYILNYLHGNGLVYNIGEYYNALSSSFYTFLLIYSSLLITDIQTASVLLSTIFLALTVVIFTKIFAEHMNRYFVMAAGILLIGSRFFYTVYGMETTCFVFLIGLNIYLFTKRNYFLLGVFSALMIVTRGEGVFLVFAMAVEHFRQKRPFPKFVHFILPMAILATYLAANRLYFGHFLPHTLTAKMDQGASGLWGSWPAFVHIGYQYEWFFTSDPLLLFVLIIFVSLGFIYLGLRSINIIIAVFLVLYSLFFLALNIPAYHWYYAPYYVLGFYYFGAGMYGVTQFIQKKTSRWIRIAAQLILCLAFIYVLSASVHFTYKSVRRAGPVSTYHAIGKWLRDHTAADSKIALVEIGTVGFYSQRYIIDILGLVNPHNSKFIRQRDYRSWLNHYDPDYVLTHIPVWPAEVGVVEKAKQGRFILDTRFRHDKFRLYRKNE